MKLFVSALVAGFAITSAAFAWGPNGHRITARVAEDSLSEQARSAVQAIAGARSLALLATWPDFIRSFKEYDCFKPMHFLTVEDGQDFDNALKVKPFKSRNCTIDDFDDFGLPSNVVSGIDFFAAILAGDNERTANFAAFMEQVGAEGLIEKEALSYSEFAEFLNQEFADKPAVEFGEGPKTWALESVAHRDDVYNWGGNPNFNLPKLSYVYAA